MNDIEILEETLQSLNPFAEDCSGYVQNLQDRTWFEGERRHEKVCKCADRNLPVYCVLAGTVSA